jgi:hypothetical protein
MALDPIDVIRRFEPILYFHRDERFFPSDAKRYMEHCGLWDVIGVPRDSKTRWGGTSAATFPHRPRIPRGKLIVGKDEPPVVPDSPDSPGNGTFIGDPQQAAVILLDNADAERFLDPAGWMAGSDPAGYIGDAVNAATETRHADIDFLAVAYSAADAALTASRFWYHAEVFSAARLNRLIRDRGKTNQDRLAALKDPALVCYYLFFPGHDQPLEGCDSMAGRLWASCVGAWACVAVLLEGDGNQNNYDASLIGLTAGNAGLLDFLGEQRRLGMQVFDWDLVTKVTRPRPNAAFGEHPRIFVARGTHGLCRDQNARPLPEFSPTDVSSSSCGEYERLAAAFAAEAAERADREEDDRIMVGKFIAAATAGAVGGSFMGPLGALGGAIAGGLYAGTVANLLEGSVVMARLAGLQPPAPVAGTQFDRPPGPGEIGTVIHPHGVDPPDAPVNGRQQWPRLNAQNPDDERKLDTVIDGRSYSLWVANSGDPDSRPVWLPSEDPNTPSFRGRWGNRVENDPFNRRVGMRFPEFWFIFINALGK